MELCYLYVAPAHPVELYAGVLSRALFAEAQAYCSLRTRLDCSIVAMQLVDMRRCNIDCNLVAIFVSHGMGAIARVCGQAHHLLVFLDEMNRAPLWVPSVHTYTMLPTGSKGALGNAQELNIKH